MRTASTIFLEEVVLLSFNQVDFYDPDGYYFNKEGYDEFGGHYDEALNYHPGSENQKEFESKPLCVLQLSRQRERRGRHRGSSKRVRGGPCSRQRRSRSRIHPIPQRQ